MAVRLPSRRRAVFACDSGSFILGRANRARRTAMTNEAGSVVTDEMRAQLNVESEPWTVEVDKSAVRMFARSCQYDDPLFYDEAFAQSKGYRSLAAPPHY